MMNELAWGRATTVLAFVVWAFIGCKGEDVPKEDDTSTGSDTNENTEGDTGTGSDTDENTEGDTGTGNDTDENTGDDTDTGSDFGGLPPDPADVATATKATVAYDMFRDLRFMWHSKNPVQLGVEDGAITQKRIAVIRGRILDDFGAPLPGAVVTVKDHPEFGHTLSRTDGAFDLAMSGGGQAVIRVSMDGYLTADRRLDVHWRTWENLNDIVLVPLDPQATQVVLDGSGGSEIAMGSVVTDEDGTRQAAVVFPEGTTATLVLPDGTERPVSTGTLRITEFTVGDRGPAAMPADLPPASAYTYCAEISLDEALSVSAETVRFDRPVPFYVDNFLGFPVGDPVPTGTYDRRTGQWEALENGRVIAIVGETLGMADIDGDGDGVADDAAVLQGLGIDDAERTLLASTREPGTTLWRVPLTHFTPVDCNWPYRCRGLCPAPGAPGGQNDRGESDDDEPCQPGSAIACHQQTLGERIPVTGTPWSLGYSSGRVPGYRPSYRMWIPVIPKSVPNSLLGATLEVRVAGRLYREEWEEWELVEPQIRHLFEWDGLDAYGRHVPGIQSVNVRLGYTYEYVYATPEDNGFGFSGDPPDEPLCVRGEEGSTCTATVWTSYGSYMGSFDFGRFGLGGWSLDAHHVFDPEEGVLFLGDGRKVFPNVVTSRVVGTFAGSGDSCGVAKCGLDGPALEIALDGRGDMVAEPDGGVLFTELNRVARITPDGQVETIAGMGSCDGRCCGDGGPATEAKFRALRFIDRAEDGTIYVVDEDYDCRAVRAIGPDGIVRKVAFDPERQGEPPSIGEPAIDASPGAPAGIAVGPDGSIYVADWYFNMVRVIGTDGIIRRFAGAGERGYDGDGGPAVDALLDEPHDLAIGPGGDLFIADVGNNRVRRVGPDGIITTVAGDGRYHNDNVMCEQGVPATESCVSPEGGVAVDRNGVVFISGGKWLSMVDTDGTLRWIGGTGGAWPPGTTEEGAPAATSEMEPEQLVILPDGSLVFGDKETNSYRRLASASGGVSSRDALVPSPDGRELFRFDPTGRHLETTDILTNALLASFDYDDEGLLVAVSDKNGNRTSIERDSEGAPTALVGPWGHRTELELDGKGWLREVRRPDATSYTMEYDPAKEGLLTGFTDARGEAYEFEYDDFGRLERHDEPGDGHRTFAWTELPPNSFWDGGVEVVMTTAEGRQTVFRQERRKTGETILVEAGPDGLSQQIIQGRDGSRTVIRPDGTTFTESYGPDPRFGMTLPVLSSLVMETPGGVETEVTVGRAVVLEDPLDPTSARSIETVMSRDGEVWSGLWNAEGRTLTVTTPQGRQSVTLLDEIGRVRSATPPGLASLDVDYTADGSVRRHVIEVDGVPSETIFNYENDGDLAGWRNAEEQTWSFTRDALGRPLTLQRPDEESLAFEFDANNNVTAVTPPSSVETRMAWDAAGRLLTRRSPQVGPLIPLPLRLEYDSDNRLETVTLESGAEIALGYGEHKDDWTSLIAPDWTVALTRSPLTGQLIRAETSDGETLTRTADGPLATGMTWTGTANGSIAWTWETGMRLKTETVNGQFPVTFTYDLDGRLIGAGDLTLTRDPDSGLVSRTDAGVVGTDDIFDDMGLLESRTITVDGALVAAWNVRRDRMGRITGIDETLDGTTRNRAYVYDDGGRIHQMWLEGTLVEAFVWDANSNRTGVTTHGDTTRAATFDVRDRITTMSTPVGDLVYTWDDDGHMETMTDGGDTVTFTHRTTGQLLGAALPDGRSVTYDIDGLGRRVARRVDGTVAAAWLYRTGLHVAAELDGSGAIRARYVYGADGDVPSLRISPGGAHRIITDPLGNPRMAIDIDTGLVAHRQDYETFGMITRDDTPGFWHLGFAGGLADTETGLVHFGARDYDPAAGRWIQADPIAYLGGSWNLYAYMRGDPLNGGDFTGMGGSNDCGGNDDGDPDRERNGDSDPLIQIPYWLDSVLGLAGTLMSAAGESLGWTSTLGRSLTVIGAAATVITMPIAVEGARQTGEQLAGPLIREPQARRDRIIQEAQSAVFRN